MKFLQVYWLLIVGFAPCSAQINQLDSNTVAAKMATAWNYIYCDRAKQQPQKAFEIFSDCAAAGNAEAMNALGVHYKMGFVVTKDKEKARTWFFKAAQTGYVKAWYNLGLLKKEELDFIGSYQCFVQAASLNDPQSIYAQAYMLYKGLGCQQNYKKAASLFAIGAAQGKPNSMYFYGLCLRNGYGVVPNEDSSRYWLTESARLGWKAANDELAAKESEKNVVGAALAQKIKAAQAILPKKNIIANKYQKVEHEMAVSNVAGIYSGFLLKYDWSGEHIIEANKLQISINYFQDSLQGIWLEDDSLQIPFNAFMNKKGLVFNGMAYRKTNHYSPRKGELAQFKKAQLVLDYTADGVYLSGSLEQFIPSRNEPSKPLFLALVRTSASNSKEILKVANEDGSFTVATPLRTYPNPFVNTITIDFDLKEKCEVTTQLLTLDGKEVYNNPAGFLEKGSYSLPIQTQQVASGYYTLVLRCGKKIRTAKVVKL